MDLLSATFKKMLCKITGYYQGGITYRFVYNSTGIELVKLESDARLPLILIVSREHYQEKINKYPVEDKKSLLNVLKIELNAPNEKYLITSHEPNQSLVNVWRFEPSLPKALCILPETFLLQQQLSNNNVIVKDSKPRKLYVATFNQAVSSLFESDFIHSVERFSFSIGQTLGSKVNISSQDIPAVLIDNMLKVNKGQLLTFISKASANKVPFSTKAIAISSMLIVSSYFLLTSLWLVWQKSTLENTFSDQEVAVEQALTLQNQVATLEQDLMVMDEFLLTQQATAPIWLVLSSILEKTELSASRYNNGRYVIIGETPKATSLLESISLLPFVQDATFDVPIRMTSDAETYSISFRLLDVNKAEGRGDVQLN
jgi:hypothetical protein